MNREDIHAKLDKLFDSMDALMDKAGDTFEVIKDKAEDKLEDLKAKAPDSLDELKLTAEAARDSAARAACRGKGWLRDALTEAQMSIDGVQDRFEAAKVAKDRAAAELCTKAIEKYAAEMLDIAQEAADEAADAVVDAVKARKDFEEKFGK